MLMKICSPFDGLFKYITGQLQEKHFLLLVFFVFSASLSRGQIRLFASGGPQSTQLKYSGAPTFFNTEVGPYLLNRNGARIGLQANIPFKPQSPWALVPGIFYSTKGFSSERNFDTTGAASPFYFQSVSEKQDYIEIPVLIHYSFKFGKKTRFMLGAGPGVNLFYQANRLTETYSTLPSTGGSIQVIREETKGETGSDPGKFQSLYPSAHAEAGFDFGGMQLKGFFSRGLSNFRKEVPEGSYVHQSIGAQLLIRIAKTAEPSSGKKPEVVAVAPPKDTDGDGVPDQEDNCPTQPGSKENKGCPIEEETAIAPVEDNTKKTDTIAVAPIKAQKAVVQEEVKKEAARIAAQIQFSFGKTDIDPKYETALQEVADLLRADSALLLTIEGHTDNKGSLNRNKVISQQRADAIKKYLQKLGVQESRMNAIGWGPEKPIATNDTEAGRAANRRVEFKLSYPE